MPRAPDLSGRALDGRYELHEVIGEGAFGRVYAGRDRRLARTVAVKVIKPWWAEDGEWVGRFEREAQLMASVSDPGIVQIFDVGHAEEGPYYVAELVDGESLSERLRRGPLPPTRAREIAEQLCTALASAHARGVVHCDVKPANVMLARSGAVKVGDFGIARLAGGTSQALSATVAGTPRYMSPEQARGLATTPATDVYSAAVVLYEMLSGKPPFEHGSPVELGLRHIQDEPPPLPPQVPRPLREIVARGLAKEPSERFADASEMARALGKAGAGDAQAGGAQAAEAQAVGAARAREDPRRAPSVEPAAGVARRIPRAGAGAASAEAAPDTDARTLDLAAARAAAAAPTSVIERRSPPPRPPRQTGSGPGAHRRRRLGLAAALLVLLAGAIAFVLFGSGAKTTVPELRGLPAGGVSARAERTHLHPEFSRRYADARSGIAVAQSPAPGTRVAENSTVHVILSAGPPPVRVPGVVGDPSAAAEIALANAGLRYALNPIAAPGSSTGEVLAQSPAATTSAPHGSTVALSVAEAPRWRVLTSFSGIDDGRSVPFQIRGRKWRVRYSMSYRGTCLLILTCLGPSAEARDLHSGAAFGSFELGEGTEQTHVFEAGPGLYRVEVSGGEDSAEWSMTVEDYY